MVPLPVVSVAAGVVPAHHKMGENVKVSSDANEHDHDALHSLTYSVYTDACREGHIDPIFFETALAVLPDCSQEVTYLYANAHSIMHCWYIQLLCECINTIDSSFCDELCT